MIAPRTYPVPTKESVSRTVLALITQALATNDPLVEHLAQWLDPVVEPGDSPAQFTWATRTSRTFKVSVTIPHTRIVVTAEVDSAPAGSPSRPRPKR